MAFSSMPAAASDAAFSWPVGSPWPSLPPGTELTVLKRAPDGADVTSYRGVVIGATTDGDWTVVEAHWVNRQVDLDGLSFVPGDRLLEAFSHLHPFNAFAVYAPDGSFRGWYANVTYPSTVEVGDAAGVSVLVWQDLYLDIVALPDGTVHVRDEDELAESDLATTDPSLHAAIVAAKDELLRRLAAGALPFCDLTTACPGPRDSSATG